MSDRLDYIRAHPFKLSEVPPEAQTEALCLAAVQSNGLAIAYAHHQTEAIQQAAVMENAYTISRMTNPSLATCLIAVNRDYTNLVGCRMALDDMANPGSGQLVAWLDLLRACQIPIDSNYTFTDSQLVEDLVKAIPLGKQFLDEWEQPTGEECRMLDFLRAFAEELKRLAPDDPLIGPFVDKVQAQVELSLRRRIEPDNASELGTDEKAVRLMQESAL